MILKKIIFNALSFFDESFALRFIFKAKVGEKCRLISNNYGSEPFLIEIGNHVSATKVTFITHDGGVWIFREKKPDIDLIKNIKIESNVFIGHGAIILPGTHIESDVIIGAGSVVKGKILSGNVYAGVPAKIICNIDEYFMKNKINFIYTKNMNAKTKNKFLKKKFLMNK